MPSCWVTFNDSKVHRLSHPGCSHRAACLEKVTQTHTVMHPEAMLAARRDGEHPPHRGPGGRTEVSQDRLWPKLGPANRFREASGLLSPGVTPSPCMGLWGAWR